jgi:hypothetical protein
MNFSSSNCPGLTGLLLLSKVFPSYSCIVYKVQRTFGFWIDDEKNPCYVDFFSLSASHLNPNLVRCRLPFWVHLGDAPKHKHPGSGSYLPQDQKCDAPVLNSPPEVQRTFGFWIDDEKCPFGGDFFSLSASHLNPTQPYKFVNW